MRIEIGGRVYVGKITNYLPRNALPFQGENLGYETCIETIHHELYKSAKSGDWRCELKPSCLVDRTHDQTSKQSRML